MGKIEVVRSDVEDIKAVSEVVEEIIIGGAYKATKYLSDKRTVKATRKRIKKFTPAEEKRHPVEIMITIGRPNYEERENIKQARKSGQGPIEMTIKYPPKKK